VQSIVADDDPLSSPAKLCAIKMADEAARLADQQRPSEPIRDVAPVFPVCVEPTSGDVSELQGYGGHRPDNEDRPRNVLQHHQCFILFCLADLSQGRNRRPDNRRCKVRLRRDLDRHPVAGRPFALIRGKCFAPRRVMDH
jgi:hypothetical protein